MCVIIDRKPGAKIPQAMLETACDINPDGYGFAYADKGELFVARSLAKNDPVAVAALLDEHLDKRVYLHLRYATVGDVTEENNHPLIAMTKKEFGLDLAFMHNGTLTGYANSSDKKKSDTYYFNELFVRPLAVRCFAYQRMFKKTPLDDHFFKRQLELKCKPNSVLLVADGHGNVLHINEEKGKTFDWGWASNDYSFDTQHWRSSKSTWNQRSDLSTSGLTNQYPWADNDEPAGTSSNNGFGNWARQHQGRGKPTRTTPAKAGAWDNWDTLVEATEKGAEEPIPFDTSVEDALRNINAKKVGHLISTNWKITSHSMSSTLKEKVVVLGKGRKTFVEQTGIKDIFDVARLSRQDFTKLCKDFPETMPDLFIDMAHELKLLRSMNKDA